MNFWLCLWQVLIEGWVTLDVQDCCCRTEQNITVEVATRDLRRGFRKQSYHKNFIEDGEHNNNPHGTRNLGFHIMQVEERSAPCMGLFLGGLSFDNNRTLT